jgi:hypothetical protein
MKPGASTAGWTATTVMDPEARRQRPTSIPPAIEKRTGMEPWFEFWKAVRYALQQIWIEWEARQAYLKETL